MKPNPITRKSFTLLWAVSLMAVCGCSTVDVTTDYDRSASFAGYRTYALKPPTNAPALSPASDAALRSTLRDSLAARGIHEVAASEKPDLAVVPHLQAQQKYSRQVHSAYGPGGWPYSYGTYGMWLGAPTTYTTIDSYTEGTLILDFVDTSKQKLVFRGVGKGTVSGPESNADKVAKAVREIVAKFPVPARQ